MAAILENSMTTAKAPPSVDITYEQFLDWLDGETYAEWVDGKVVPMAPANAQHQDISGFLGALLRLRAEDQAAGMALAAPFQMRLSRIRRGRQPDLMFVAKSSLTRLKPDYLDGPADWIIEIASAESLLRDRGEKYAEYEASGVREYWIVDPDAKRVDFFVLGDDGRFERAKQDDEGKYESAVLPGFWINVGWLWRSFLPSVRQVLKDWEAAA